MRDEFGPRSGDEAIRQALAGTDRALYEAVYSFALEDLGEFARLGEAELRQRCDGIGRKAQRREREHRERFSLGAGWHDAFLSEPRHRPCAADRIGGIASAGCAR